MTQAKSVRNWLLQFDSQAEKLVIPAMRRAMESTDGSKPNAYKELV